jgi:hypothetical protein
MIMCWCNPSLRTPCCGGIDCHPPESCSEDENNVLENSVWLKRDNYTSYHTNGEGLISYSNAEKRCEKLPEIEMFMHDSGMCATHNMPCPVCKTNHAVFVTSSGFFDVCHDCRSQGWFVGKREVKSKKFWEIWK